jgi:hypothetical protein
MMVPKIFYSKLDPEKFPHHELKIGQFKIMIFYNHGVFYD